jgi:SAM-dependent methyltransferase
MTEEEYVKLERETYYPLTKYHPDVTGYQAAYYGYYSNLMFILKNILKLQTQNLNLMDLGCGYGLFLHLLNEEKVFKSVQGIEWDTKFVSRANELFPNIKIKGDAFNSKITGINLFYTFRITKDRTKFASIIKRMQPGQMFVEMYDTWEYCETSIADIPFHVSLQYEFVTMRYKQHCLLIRI